MPNSDRLISRPAALAAARAKLLNTLEARTAATAPPPSSLVRLLALLLVLLRCRCHLGEQLFVRRVAVDRCAVVDEQLGRGDHGLLLLRVELGHQGAGGRSRVQATGVGAPLSDSTVTTASPMPITAAAPPGRTAWASGTC